jgi:hypothetical protein
MGIPLLWGLGVWATLLLLVSLHRKDAAAVVLTLVVAATLWGALLTLRKSPLGWMPSDAGKEQQRIAPEHAKRHGTAGHVGKRDK